MRRDRVERIITAASTYVGFAVIVGWLVEKMVGELRRTVDHTAQTMSSAVTGVVEDLMQLVAPVPRMEKVPQQSPEEWARQSLILPESLEDFDDIDWTDLADQELDDRLQPERVFLPLEDRHAGPTGIPVPDLAGEW